MMMNMSNAVDQSSSTSSPADQTEEQNANHNAVENQKEGCNANARNAQDTLLAQKKQIELTDPSIDLEAQGENEFNKVLRRGSAVPQQQYTPSTFAPKNNKGRENNTNNAE
jgi:hypothetical protein